MSTDEYAIEDAWDKYKEMDISMNDFRRETRTSMEAQLSRGTFLPESKYGETLEEEEEDGSPGQMFADPSMFFKSLEDSSHGKAEMAPQIDMPQRVGHPSSVNAPPRMTSTNRDERILSVFGSKGAKGAKEQDNSNATPDNVSRRKGMSAIKNRTQNNNTALKKLKDLDILVKTCRRAGKQIQEAQALYCRGVLFDNMEKWTKAIECYEAYLRLCHHLNDEEGATVAYNCCAVNYFNLAVGGGEVACRAVGLVDDSQNGSIFDENDDLLIGRSLESARGAAQRKNIGEVATELLNKAIAFNLKHLEFSDDAGQFVALCNVGLCYSRLGEFRKSLEYHQQALKLAIDLHSPHAQSLAVGNLALTSAELQDWETARACMDKHLHLVRDLHNAEAESLACQQLGQMANKHGNYEDASYYFEEAQRIALSGNERGMLKLIRCNIGVVSGNLRMNEYLSQISKEFKEEL